MYDIIIRHGTVVDGAGAAPRTADVAIEDGRIVDVGVVDGGARRSIDADGAYVLPGWIDAHTHYDGQVTWDSDLEGSAVSGVTTVVMGNCGVGFAPVRRGEAQPLIELMEGVEDIPGPALAAGIPWGQWETFPEYMDFLARRSWTADIGTQLPHAALRFYVMGERAIADEQPTDHDIAEMSTLAKEACESGALGFSTSRILGHRSVTGSSVPGTHAPDSELRAIVQAMRSAGGGVLQVIPASTIGELPGLGPERAAIEDEIRLLAALSSEYDTPVTFSSFQIPQAPTQWRSTLDLVHQLNRNGARLTPMIAARAGTLLTTLFGYHVFMRRPTFIALAERTGAALVEVLRNPDVKAAILAEDDCYEGRLGAMENVLPRVLASQLDYTFELTDPIDYEPQLSTSIGMRAAKRGVDPLEEMYDFLLEDVGTSVAVLLKSNYVDGNLDACREMLCDPSTVSGLSDAGAHVSFICDMALPTFHLTHWVRGRTRGERIPIESIVPKLTSVPASLFGLDDRGTIEVGKRADINVVDLDRLSLGRPSLRSDLPGGGKRFLQSTTGYVATLVNGETTRLADADTGTRAGRLIRRRADQRRVATSSTWT